MKKADVRQSLIKQLEDKGANVSHFEDLVNDYMNFWSIKSKLQTDIRKRGIVYEDKSSVGIVMQKNNPTVKELVNVNRQMLSILRELGLSTDEIVCSDDDEL